MQFAGTDEALYERHLLFDSGVAIEAATARDRFEALARSVRDILSQRWLLTEKTYEQQNPKRLYYLSMEFLIGRSLANNVTNLLLFPLANFVEALTQTLSAETLTRVLYPDDSSFMGQGLRLMQQYFLVACSLADAVRRFQRGNSDWQLFADKVAIQMNDTHPALSVPELMRILVDPVHLGWDEAWHITQHTLGYTNHTLLPEALEKWPVKWFEDMLPRQLDIIYEINRRFLGDVRRHDEQSAGQKSGRGGSEPSASRGLVSSRRSQINSRIMRMNRGCVPTVSARTICSPNSSQSSRAWVSRSKRISMWSETKPMGAITTAEPSPRALYSRR